MRNSGKQSHLEMSSSQRLILCQCSGLIRSLKAMISVVLYHKEKKKQESEIIESGQNKRLLIGSEYISNLCHFQCTPFSENLFLALIQIIFGSNVIFCQENDGFVQLQCIKELSLVTVSHSGIMAHAVLQTNVVTRKHSSRRCTAR